MFTLLTVRLVGSELPHEGRLEVYYNGQWGTVCYDGFDDEDATVACNGLGSGLAGYFCEVSKVVSKGCECDHCCMSYSMWDTSQPRIRLCRHDWKWPTT